MKSYTKDQLTAFRAMLEPYRKADGSFSYAVLAKEIGDRRTTWANRADAVLAAEMRGELGPGFKVEEPDSELPTLDELLESRRKEFERIKKAKKQQKLINVNVKLDGPFGICHFGDPHVDDPGTNIELIEQHVEIVKRTPALFAGNIGDLNNNWVGRLARLHAEQRTTAKEAWMLVEWLLKSMPWLYVVFGNHDAWSGDRDPLEYILKHCGSAKGSWGTRLNLVSPNGCGTRINARHDFHGHSMWNTVHGPAKAAKMGWRDHVLVCGHKHTSGYAMDKCPASGLVSHIIRVASYKQYDRYAEELGLPDQACFAACVTVIDPTEPDDSVRRVVFFADVEHGADYLTFLRKKKRA